MSTRANSWGIDSKSKAAAEVFGSATVEPHKSGKVFIGYFEKGAPEPELEVTCTPDVGEMMGKSLDRGDGVHDYGLIMHFENFGDVPYTATVARRPEGRQR